MLVVEVENLPLQLSQQLVREAVRAAMLPQHAVKSKDPAHLAGRDCFTVLSEEFVTGLYELCFW